jgi:serine/threonine protein kinase
MISLDDYWPLPESIGNYAVKYLIGHGSFSSVWLADHCCCGARVAIKAVHSSALGNEQARTRFVREIGLMKRLDHPFIGKLFEVIETKEFVLLVEEFAPNGTLFSHVNKRHHLPEVEARRFFTQLIKALEYIHEEKRMMHRDIKAENVLLDANNNIRLIDFGFSRAFEEDESSFRTSCGSPAYAAPEMIRGQPYTKAADLWSAGILLYAMVVGELPFDDDESIQRILVKVVRTEPEYPQMLTPTLVDLLQKMLEKDPLKRIDLAGIKRHPWMSGQIFQKIFEIPFGSDEWLVSGLDFQLADKARDLGFDIRMVSKAIKAGELTCETAQYAILRQKKITELLKITMDNLPKRMLCGCQSAGPQKIMGLLLEAIADPTAPLTFPRATPASHTVIVASPRLATPHAPGLMGKGKGRGHAKTVWQPNVRPRIALGNAAAG